MEILLFVLLFFACLYFLPSIIAAFRNTHHLPALFLLNLLLGWTFIGWVLTLFIALLIERRDEYELRRQFFLNQVGAPFMPPHSTRSRTFLLVLTIILTVLLVIGLSENASHVMTMLHDYASNPTAESDF